VGSQAALGRMIIEPFGYLNKMVISRL